MWRLLRHFVVAYYGTGGSQVYQNNTTQGDESVLGNASPGRMTCSQKCRLRRRLVGASLVQWVGAMAYMIRHDIGAGETADSMQ